jgi:hypothetical protein
MSTIKGDIGRAFHNAVKFCFLKQDGSISITKTLANTSAACAAILSAPVTFPAALATIGISGVIIVLPAVVTKTVTAIGAVAAYAAMMKAKNDLDKNKEEIKK